MKEQHMEQTYDRVGEMYAYYATGKTLAEVGEHFGITKQRVGAIFKRHGYKLTKRHGFNSAKVAKQQILDYIRDYRAEHSISPNYAEMAIALGRGADGRGNVSLLVKDLIDEGFLVETVAGNPRSLLLTVPQPRAKYYEAKE